MQKSGKKITDVQYPGPPDESDADDMSHTATVITNANSSVMSASSSSSSTLPSTSTCTPGRLAAGRSLPLNMIASSTTSGIESNIALTTPSAPSTSTSTTTTTGSLDTAPVYSMPSVQRTTNARRTHASESENAQDEHKEPNERANPRTGGALPAAAAVTSAAAAAASTDPSAAAAYNISSGQWKVKTEETVPRSLFTSNSPAGQPQPSSRGPLLINVNTMDDATDSCLVMNEDSMSTNSMSYPNSPGKL